MRTGNIVQRSEIEPFLDEDKWLEVYPESPADVDRLAALPKQHKCGLWQVNHKGQSPLLVRLSTWEGMQ